MISIIIIGFCAGLYAMYVMNVSSTSKLITLGLGIGGVFLGEWLRDVLHIGNDNDTSLFSPIDWFSSIIGSVILIWIYNKFIADKI